MLPEPHGWLSLSRRRLQTRHRVGWGLLAGDQAHSRPPGGRHDQHLFLTGVETEQDNKKLKAIQVQSSRRRSSYRGRWPGSGVCVYPQCQALALWGHSETVGNHLEAFCPKGGILVDSPASSSASHCYSCVALGLWRLLPGCGKWPQICPGDPRNRDT